MMMQHRQTYILKRNVMMMMKIKIKYIGKKWRIGSRTNATNIFREIIWNHDGTVTIFNV